MAKKETALDALLEEQPKGSETYKKIKEFRKLKRSTGMPDRDVSVPHVISPYDPRCRAMFLGN